MQGFLNLRWSRFKRVVLTRSIAILPTLILAIFTDIENLTNLNDVLNVLQSLLLPFALIPILHFSAMPRIMGTYASEGFWLIFGPLVSFFIIGINLFFVYIAVIESESTITYVIVGVVGTAYLAFAGYITWLYFRDALIPQCKLLLKKSGSQNDVNYLETAVDKIENDDADTTTF